jgi:hypothetical protein
VPASAASELRQLSRLAVLSSTLHDPQLAAVHAPVKALLRRILPTCAAYYHTKDLALLGAAQQALAAMPADGSAAASSLTATAFARWAREVRHVATRRRTNFSEFLEAHPSLPQVRLCCCRCVHCCLCVCACVCVCVCAALDARSLYVADLLFTNCLVVLRTLCNTFGLCAPAVRSATWLRTKLSLG